MRSFFLIRAMALVVMMQVGFMFLESSQPRFFMECLVDVRITVVAFMLLDFTIAFPEYAKGLGGWLSGLFSAEAWAADPMKSMLPRFSARAVPVVVLRQDGDHRLGIRRREDGLQSLHTGTVVRSTGSTCWIMC